MAGQDLDIDALIRRIRRTDVSGLQGALTTMGKVQFWSSLAKKCRKSRNYREVCDPISWVSSLGQPYFARAPPSSWERLTAPLVRAFVMDGSAATPALLELAACLPSTTAAGEGGEGEGVDLVRLRREENSRQRTAFHCLDLALPYTRLFRTEQQRIDFMRRICKPASEGGCDYMDWVAAALLRNRRVDFEQTGPLAAMFPSLSFPNHRHPSIVVGARTNPEAWHSIAAALRRWGTAPAAECADFDAPPSEFHHQWLARYLDELVSRDQDSLLPLFNELLPEGTVLVPDHVDGYDVPSWLSVKWIAVERNNAARVMYRLAMHAARRPRELAAIIASKRMWSVIAHALDGGIPAQLMDETAAHCCAAVAGMFARLTASEIVVRAPGEPLPNVAPFEAVAHEQVEGNTTAFVYLLVAPFLDVQSVVSLAAACRTARDALFSDGVDDPDGSPRFNRAAAYAWAYIGANTVVERNGGKQLIRALARGFHDSCEPQQMQEEHPDDYERIVGIIGSDRPSVVLDDVGVTPEEAKRRLATLSPGHRETVPPILTHFIIASTRVQHLHDDEPEPPPMHWEERSQQIPTEVLSSAGVALVRLALLPGVARRLAAIRFDVDEDDSAAADAAADNDVAGNEATGAAGAGGAGSAAGGARTPPDDAGDDAESLAKGALSSLLAIILRCTLVEWPALLPEIFRSLYVRPPTGQTPAQCVNLLVTVSGVSRRHPAPCRCSHCRCSSRGQPSTGRRRRGGRWNTPGFCESSTASTAGSKAS